MAVPEQVVCEDSLLEALELRDQIRNPPDSGLPGDPRNRSVLKKGRTEECLSGVFLN